MEERAACALLKARFEAAGFQIEENRGFAEAGVQFEIDGYDPARRVGYEYVSEEAGDSWDVDTVVVGKLDAARKTGDVFILVVDEHDAPDADSLAARADAFLAELRATLPVVDEEIADDGDADSEDEAEGANGQAPASKPAPQVTAKPTAKVAAKTATKAAAKPATKTTAKPATKVTAKPATKVAAKPATKAAAKPAAKPVTKPTKPAAAQKPAAKKAATKPAAAKKPKPAAKKPAAKKR